MTEIILRCQCADCTGVPIAKVQNGCVIIQANHHGRQHTNVVTLRELARLAEESAEAVAV